MSEFEKGSDGTWGRMRCFLVLMMWMDMMWLHQSIMACLLCSIEVRRAAVLQ